MGQESCSKETPRIFFADTIPLAVPQRLEDLRGPENGWLDLPITVFWAPNRHFPINSDSQRIEAYKNILERGTRQDICAFINAAHLRRLWPELHPSPRVKRLWETRFPELTHHE
ncbi:transcriptional regulator [Schaalia sp. lx-100]|uniref:transcriptional regulator n=1 Tax=Schaalia sp. lx-100 TaxID=2899081 RepID=UPI001E411C8B|nr:transcriptional regulator [Schaalia sp. lx-100]MCD4556954.1 transcriptional regulator [Schaalia sp. lx-100]